MWNELGATLDYPSDLVFYGNEVIHGHWDVASPSLCPRAVVRDIEVSPVVMMHLRAQNSAPFPGESLCPCGLAVGLSFVQESRAVASRRFSPLGSEIRLVAWGPEMFSLWVAHDGAIGQDALPPSTRDRKCKPKRNSWPREEG